MKLKALLDLMENTVHLKNNRERLNLYCNNMKLKKNIKTNIKEHVEFLKYLEELKRNNKW